MLNSPLESMKNHYFTPLLLLLLLTHFLSHAQTVPLGNNFGYTQGSFQATDGGAATYYIPFVLPPGTAGLQPKIGLSYSSQAGNSFVGLGWSLSGLSTITRSSKTRAQDETSSAIQQTKAVDLGISYDKSDRFSLDGERLVLAPESVNTTIAFDDNYGNDQTVYYTEQNGFSKVVLTENATTQSPQFFKVYTKSGLIFEYGNTTDSRIMDNTKNIAIQWLVNKIEDRKGNYMKFTYIKDATTDANGEVYPSKIEYTGNVSGGLLPYNTIEFNYDTRLDPTTVYGIRFQRANRYTKILKNVKVKYQTTLIREYILSYDNSTQYSLLNQVQECDGNSPQNCFKPTKFDWSNIKQDIGTPIEIAALPGTNDRRIWGDYNGDGLQDIAVWDFQVATTPYTLVVNFYINNGNGAFNLSSSSTISTTITSDAFNGFFVRKGEFNGDNIADLVATWNPTATTVNNSLFMLSNPPVSTNGLPYQYPCAYYTKLTRVGNTLADDLIIDINRDGITDFVDISAPSNTPTLNQVYVPAILPTTTVSPTYYNVVDNTALNNSLYNAGWPTTTAPEQLYEDLDNDGFTDIFIYDKVTGENLIISPYSTRQSFTEATRSIQFQTRINRGDRTWLQNSWIAGTNNKLLLADMNGDDLADILVVKPSTNQVCIIQNKGSGLNIFEQTQSNHKCVILTGSLLTTYPNVTVSDLNADGLQDITFYETVGGTNRTFINQGEYVFNFNTAPILLNSWPVERFKDNGTTNPKPEIGSFLRGSHVDLYYYNTANSKHYLRRLQQSQGLTIKKFTNGANLEVNVNYDNLLNSELYEKAGDVTFPDIDFQSPLYVVSKVTMNTPNDETAKKYRYCGAKINVEGRGFRGFSKVIETDTITGICDARYYKQGEGNWKYTGSTLLKTERCKSNTELISRTVHDIRTISYPTNYGTSYFAYEFEETTFDNVNNKTQKVRKLFDNYGNPTKVVVDYGEGFKDSTLNVYVDNTTSWFLGRLTQSKVFRMATGVPTIERWATFGYDVTTGYLNQEVSDANSAAQLRVTKTYSYDTFGNITQSNTNAWNGTAFEDRTVLTDYDNLTKRFIEKTTNPLGHFSTATYDQRFGVPLTQTDLNGLVSTYEYDGFSRLKKQTLPDNSWSAISYREKNPTFFQSPANSEFLTYTETSTGQISIEHFDAYSRSIQNKSKGFDSRWVIVDHKFSRVVSPRLLEKIEDSYPYYEGETPEGFNERQLDDLGRVIANKQSKTGGVRSANVVYAGLLTESTNYKNQKMSSIEDVKGRTLETTWQDGSRLLFTYDAADRLLTTKDPKGNTITNQYDIRGFKTQMNDPDMGIYQYTYNGFGELKTQQYPNGNIVSFTYDLLGRILTRTDADGTTNYTYDTGIKGIGKPSAITSYAPNTSYVSNHSFIYDALGRKSQEITTFPELNKTYTTTYTYNVKGQLNTVSYPAAGLVLKNVYNDYGFLSELRNGDGSNTLFWKVLTTDAAGSITNQEFGNGVQTQHEYEVATRFLSSIKSLKGTDILQHFSYQYNDLGHLLSRKDEKRNNTESFGYDDINRLIETKINDVSKTTLTYDELGNITYKSDVGYYEYGEANSGPHRLVNLRTNNANVSCSFTQNFPTTYTSFNKVKTIANDTSRVEVFYGPDQQRIMQKMFVRNVLTRTKIYLGLSEIEIFASNGLTRTTNYIGGVGIQVNKTQGTTTTSQIKYYLKDHLGSVTGFTGNTGQVLEEFSYDAWGLRRNADWTVATNLNSSHERGFTNHEHYDLFSIIDMNGRIYDPVLGRFLQADPFIQEADNLQSYNRYSYVLNNPLSYTDPSGYWGWNPFKAIKNVFNAVIGVAKAVVNFVKENWKPLVTIAVVLAVTWATGGFGTQIFLSQAIFSGAAAGFAGNVTGTLLNGGSFSDALKSGFRGAVVGGVSAGLSHELLPFGKTSIYKTGTENLRALGIRTIGNGAIQGTTTEVTGGKFSHGFIAGGLSSGFLGSGNIAKSAILGGLVSEMNGGSFANGAITAAFAYTIAGWIKEPDVIPNSQQDKEFTPGSDYSSFSPENFFGIDVNRPAFTHDGDYSTSGMPKWKADLNFFQNIRSNNLVSGDVLRNVTVNITATWYYGAVTIFGWSPYNAAQSEALMNYQKVSIGVK
jgi:RHS repeat-associated protein